MCPRLILLKASRANALITPEHCVLSLHKDREVHAAQFQHHATPRYWTTECEGCTIFHPIGMYAPARTCCTPSPREIPILCMVWISPAHGPALSQRANDVSPMLCLQTLHSSLLPRTPKYNLCVDCSNSDCKTVLYCALLRTFSRLIRNSWSGFLRPASLPQ